MCPVFAFIGWSSETPEAPKDGEILTSRVGAGIGDLSRRKDNVKISNREASNKGPHRVRRGQMQGQFGVISKNNLDGGMRRKGSQAGLVEQTEYVHTFL